MRLFKARALLVIGGIVLLLAAAGAVSADEFPDRTIRIVVGFPRESGST